VSIADRVDRDCLSSAGVRVDIVPPLPRSRWGRAPDRPMGEMPLRTRRYYHQCECPGKACGNLTDG